MIGFRFTPWQSFRAIKDDALIRAWLERLAKRTHFFFRSKMEASRGGRVYRGRGGRTHRASAPGDFPAKDSGRLIGSIRTRVTANEMEIGTGMFYAIFLKNGTRKMARRKMSSDALREVLPTERPHLKGFARWKRG